ncbi:replicative DNA helicase [Halopolyspora algeriensis]|uniref:Replicative DNA helicase n=1 Tax=Halopolyspora algeriensis TaxID=1500506 RepID=A0A368VY03_9ACTN|nr:replicative DNA helicase [Halopolyspora algeriensis]RCW47078.1 replicative DNA helicase [Halopolyspora algeriensis]TQM48165.1 replicative DNA helicase [Halopolyspora algeriensis]
MALTDERGAGSSPNGDGHSGHNGTFDRQPPQDLAAEQSVLGGMMLSKDAIADVVEAVRPNDFYRPAHQAIFDCVLDLYGRGEPADPVTVSAELERRNELTRVGGAPYLHTLIATVPTAANAGYYAEIVAEKAVLRRLVEAGTRIVQFGYNGAEGAAIEEVVDRAQAAIYDVTERRTSEDYAALEDLLQPTMDEIDAIASRGGESQGIATGFNDLDAVTNGLHPGQMVIVAARPGVGKALALDTPLPTPHGWTTMGEVTAGDRLLGADGAPTTVVSATEVLHDRVCHEIEFSDGTVIVADADHQWRLADGRVLTTQQLADLPHARLAIPAHGDLQLPRRHHPVSPYTLGVWLAAGNPADGNLRTERTDLVVNLELDGLAPATDQPLFHGEITEQLAALGAWQDHHLPEEYLRGSSEQRRALLAGLLDARGTVADDGTIRLTVSEPISVRARELVLGLGYPCTAVPARDGTGEDTATGDTDFDTSVLVFDSGTDEVFRLAEKNRLHKHNRPAGAHVPTRTIDHVRQVDSVPVRCVEVDAGDRLYLASRSMIPTHNSTLGLDFARAASIKQGLGSVIFSLEMGRTEIVMRMLSAEARIRLGDMRGGRMTDDDWTRLARRMSEISEAPLFVDDSPNLTMMEIRAKARRLKQRNDIGLIVVDYMQLMTSGKKVESRQQEVSEFSRNLKLLAKELDIPVVAISQLNRGPEQRNDRRPQLSDLRESGCLTSGTRLLRADTGAEVTFGELMETGQRPIVWSLDERMRMVPRPITNVFSSGVKEVFKVRLASGREIEATANHPMLTIHDWLPLGELDVGDRVAVPRSVPEPLGVEPMPEPEIIMLAHLIGDGSFVKRQPIRYASIDEANLEAVTEAAEHFGITPVRDEYAAAKVTTLRLPAPYRLTHGKRNPIAAWLEEMGLFGLRSYEKFIPERVFSLPREQIALFLRHLWATDGSVRWDEKYGQGRIYYTTTSRRLADDLSRLLLRIDVFARIKRVRKSGYRDSYHVLVYGAENQLKFLKESGVYGMRSIQADVVAEKLLPIIGNTNRDTVPKEVWERVRTLVSDRSMTHREFASHMETKFCGSVMWKHSPSRSRLAKAAAVLDDAELETLATSDVFWDEIVEITSLGEQPVYDATVDETHNFTANGIVMHNSLEQDADMVVLIHRPDAFERDDPRMGEADLILAKHRAGPTSTVTVAHQLHYSRFVDMAQE